MKDVEDKIDISETVGPQAVMSLLVHFLQDVMDCKYLRHDKTLLHAFLGALNTEDESVANRCIRVQFIMHMLSTHLRVIMINIV